MPTPSERLREDPFQEACVFGQAELEEISRDSETTKRVLEKVRERVANLNDSLKYFALFSSQTSPLLDSVMEESSFKKRVLHDEFNAFEYLYSTFPEYLGDRYLDKASEEELREITDEHGSIEGDDLLGIVSKDKLPFDDEDMRFALETAISNGEFPDHLLVDVLKNYGEKARARLEQIQGESSEDLRFVSESLAVFFDKNPEFSEEMKRRMATTLQRIKIIYMDGFNEQMQNASGTHGQQDRNIHIDIWVDKEHRRKVLLHEFLHELSGVTFIQTEEGPKYLRGGLAFAVDKKRPDAERDPLRFRWLNEAITESATLEASNQPVDKKHASYYEERLFVHALIKTSRGKLDYKDFYGAYFEDYKNEEAVHLPRWAALQSKMEDAYGHGFLLAVEKYIANKSVYVGLPKLTKAVQKGTWEKLLTDYRRSEK